jgi:putative tryptophan/tyrosine transport system substrate-binding protein
VNNLKLTDKTGREVFAMLASIASFGIAQIVATHVEKILRGAKPSELPVEQVTRLKLVVNLRTARQMGIVIPQSILARADEVVQ